MSHQQNYPPAFTWDPTQLSGGTLVGLIDFENNAKITSSGGLISAMADSVSAASFVQATGANKPTLLTSAVTGRQVAGFNGTSQQLTVGSIPTAWPTGGSVGGIFVVCNQTAVDATSRVALSYGGNANTTNRNVQRAASGIPRANIGDGSSALTADFSPAQFIGQGIAWVEIAASISVMHYNGVNGGNKSVTPNTGTTRAVIGANSGNSAASFFTGEISAVGVYTGALSAQDINNLHIWARIRLGL